MPAETLLGQPESPQDSGAVLGIGEVAARRHLSLVPEIATLEFTPREVDVITLISEGNTVNQMARELGSSPENVKAARYGAMRRFGTKSASVLVDKSIRQGIIPIEVRPDEEALARLTDLDRNMVRFYAMGGSNRQIAWKSRVELGVVESYHDKLLEHAGVWTRPQLVRRCHELGVLF